MSTSVRADEAIDRPGRPTTWRPGRKVSAAALAGALSAITLWAITVAGLHPTPQAASGITTLIAAIAGYAAPERSGA